MDSLDKTTTSPQVLLPPSGIDPILQGVWSQFRSAGATSDPLLARLCAALTVFVERVDTLIKSTQPQPAATPDSEKDAPQPNG